MLSEIELTTVDRLVEVRCIPEVRCSEEVLLKILEIRSQKQCGDFKLILNLI